MESTAHDFSGHVEVLFDEEDGALRGGFPSDEDLARTWPRLWLQITSGSIFQGPNEALVHMALSAQREELFRQFNPQGKLSVAAAAAFGSTARAYPPFGWMRETCIFCGAVMRRVKDDCASDRRVQVSSCSKCFWWESEDLLIEDRGSTSPELHAYSFRRRAVLHEFHVADSSAPIGALRAHLAANPDDLRYVNPGRLERVIGSVLSDYLNCEVRHVGGPGDDGIDLIAVEGEHPWAIQVKRRSVETSEGVAAVREFVGAMALGRYKRGMFVTTAPSFSPAALKTALRAGELSYLDCVEMVDRDAMLQIFRSSPSAEPWRANAPSLETQFGAHEPTRRLAVFPIERRNPPEIGRD